MKSFKQHFRETSTEPQGTHPSKFRMSLRDLIDSLEVFDRKDRMVDILLDSPDADEICCFRFAPVDAPINEQHLCVEIEEEE